MRVAKILCPDQKFHQSHHDKDRDLRGFFARMRRHRVALQGARSGKACWQTSRLPAGQRSMDSTDTLVDLAARSQKVRPMGEQLGCPAGRWQKVASALEARFRVRAHFLQICWGSVVEQS